MSAITCIYATKLELFPSVVYVGKKQAVVDAETFVSGREKKNTGFIEQFVSRHYRMNDLYFIYFLSGYFLYATLYVLVGGMVSSEDDGQHAQIPLLMFILLGPLAASFVWRQPDSVLATAVSQFPFFSPFAMFLRIAVREPPLWQVILSIVLMLAAILGAVWLAAKIYRIGILMYGKRPTLPEVAKWLKYS